MSDDSSAPKEPKRVEGTRLCLSLTRDGLKAYGNRSALTSLSLSGSHGSPGTILPSTTNATSGGGWRMQLSAFDGEEPKNVWVVMESDLADHFAQARQMDEVTRDAGFELTFMAVTEQELDRMTVPGWQETSGK